MQKKAELQGDTLGIPGMQRRAPPSLITVIEAKHSDPNDANMAAYTQLDLYLATAGRVVHGRTQQCEN